MIQSSYHSDVCRLFVVMIFCRVGSVCASGEVVAVVDSSSLLLWCGVGTTGRRRRISSGFQDFVAWVSVHLLALYACPPSNSARTYPYRSFQNARNQQHASNPQSH